MDRLQRLAERLALTQQEKVGGMGCFKELSTAHNGLLHMPLCFAALHSIHPAHSANLCNAKRPILYLHCRCGLKRSWQRCRPAWSSSGGQEETAACKHGCDSL